MRSTTYSIGRKGGWEPHTPQTELKSGNAIRVDDYTPEGKQDMQFRNPNLIKNLNIGMKENSNDTIDRFATSTSQQFQTFHKRDRNGKGFSSVTPIDKFQKTAQELKSELLSSGFELGYDAKGGVKSPNPFIQASMSETQKLRQPVGNEEAGGLKNSLSNSKD